MNGVIRKLPILVVNPFSRCNCRCVMCDIWKTGETAQITRDELERHLDSVSGFGVEWVVLSGGEPLMHKDIFGLCRALRERGIRTTLLTAGLLLERFATEIVIYVDDLIVSLDGPPEVHDSIRRVTGAFEILRSGIRALRRLRAAYTVKGRCTVQRANHAHLAATVAAAREIGLDGLSFLAVDVASQAFNRPGGWAPERSAEVSLSMEQVCALEREIARLVRTGQCGAFVAESAEKLGAIARRFRSRLGDGEPLAPPCNAPWISAVLESDGAVRPCFFHPPIGSTRAGASLRDVLNGPQAVLFRAGLNVSRDPICRECVCSLERYAPCAGDPGTGRS